MTKPENNAAWRSYLMPGTDTLRTLPGFDDPVAVTLFERITSADAETRLRSTPDRPRTFDLDHLRDIHQRLFGDAYDWAGQLRYIDIGRPVQTGEPFLHHPWITTYTAGVVEQLRREDNLTNLADPNAWAARAAHYWNAMLHAHPFREGNGRSIRIWVEDLAAAAGHTLDWSRTSLERNVFVAEAAGNGDLEPMRALLTQVAGGSLGNDRAIDALDDLHKLQDAMAWARTGQGFGTDEDKARLEHQTTELTGHIDTVAHYLDTQPARTTSRTQSATVRWRGLAASIDPGIVQTDDWPQFATDLDDAAAVGIEVGENLHRIVAELRDRDQPRPPAAEQHRRATTAGPHSGPAVQRPDERSPVVPSPQVGELAAAAYIRPAPPSPGPRR